MVYSSTTYHCGECRKTHFSYEEARSCEYQHITDKAVAAVREKMDAIFASARPKINAIRQLHSGEGAGDQR